MADDSPAARHTTSAVDPQDESVEALRTLLDRVALVIVILGAAAIVVSVVRVSAHGWHPNVIATLSVFPGFIVVLLLRHRLGPRLTFWLLIALAVVLAGANYSTLGLVTVSPLMLATVCVVAAMMSGLRTGFALLAGTAVGVAAMGVAIASNALATGVVGPDYLESPQAWAMHTIAYVLQTSILLVVVSSVMSRFGGMLSRISRQSEQLAQREQLYRHLTENMRDVLFTQSMDLGITYSSPSATHMFGYTQDEIERISMEQLLTPESLRRAHEWFPAFAKKAQAGPVDVPPFEFEYVRKDGSRFWGEMRAVFLYDDNGVPIGTQGTIRDISDLKQAAREREELEARLRQSEKLQAIGQLAGGIAHDFNNQLTGIVGYSDLIRESGDTSPTVREFAERITAAAQRASELTDKLLAFARKGQYRRVPVDVHDIIDDAISILERSIDRAIVIVRRFEAVPSTIEGDPTQIENAILNLGLNARDAMPAGGTLTFATSLEASENGELGQRLILRVSDEGMGIDPAMRKRIFEPFFTTKEPGRGTGMGLAAVYGTIVGHGGTVEVVSAPGRGSTFTISLPLTHAPAGERIEPGADLTQPGQGRILLVDDDEAVRDVVARLLERRGFDVETCDDGPGALTAFGERGARFRAVILDMVLPGMGGAAVAREIRLVDPRAKLLIISGYSSDGTIDDLIEGGGAVFLRKPFQATDLARALDALLEAE